LTIRYQSEAGLLRDRLNDVPRGLMARVLEPVATGDRVDLWIQVVRAGIAISARGTVLWTMPLTKGTLAGLALETTNSREGAQLDALLGPCNAPPQAAPSASSAPAAPTVEDVPGRDKGEARHLSVLMLQPNTVLREVLSSALGRLARDAAAPWVLEIDQAATPEAFLSASETRPRGLAVVDCDGLDIGPDDLLSALRSREQAARLPVIFLSESRSARLEDRRTVTMRKPVTMKAFVQTAGILLQS
jgi:CheY-like chemotaxis protein